MTAAERCFVLRRYGPYCGTAYLILLYFFFKILLTCYVLRYGVCDSAVLFKILPVRPYRGTAYVILRYFSRYRPHSTYCGTAYVILRYLYKILPIRYVLRYGLCISTVFFKYCLTAVRPTYFCAVRMVYPLTCRSVPYVPTSTAVLLNLVLWYYQIHRGVDTPYFTISAHARDTNCILSPSSTRTVSPRCHNAAAALGAV